MAQRPAGPANSYGQTTPGSSPYASPRGSQRSQSGYVQPGRTNYGATRQSAYYSQSSAYGQYSVRQPGYAGMQDVAMTTPARGKRSLGLRVALMILVAVLGAIVGCLVALFLVGGRWNLPTPVSATLTETQLNSTKVGSYCYDGTTYDITAREAILGTESLSSALNADGSYDAPSADMVLSYARNAILSQLVKESGITVTDAEVNAYAEQTAGTSDFTTIAALNNMDEDQAHEAMTLAASVSKLRQSVEGASTATIAAPAAPADGNTEVGTQEYADYIIGLLGNHWDAANLTWADTDNAYYTALQNQVFAPGSASYEAARIAYSVALNESGSTSGGSSAWVDYVNEYLDEGSIIIATLRA